MKMPEFIGHRTIQRVSLNFFVERATFIHRPREMPISANAVNVRYAWLRTTAEVLTRMFRLNASKNLLFCVRLANIKKKTFGESSHVRELSSVSFHVLLDLFSPTFCVILNTNVFVFTTKTLGTT